MILQMSVIAGGQQVFLRKDTVRPTPTDRIDRLLDRGVAAHDIDYQYIKKHAQGGQWMLDVQCPCTKTPAGRFGMGKQHSCLFLFG